MKTWIILATASLALGACNTVSGIGQDMKAGGQAIQKVADPSSPPQQNPTPQPQTYPNSQPY